MLFRGSPVVVRGSSDFGWTALYDGRVIPGGMRGGRGGWMLA